jgi:hypothetical protein
MNDRIRALSPGTRDASVRGALVRASGMASSTAARRSRRCVGIVGVGGWTVQHDGHQGAAHHLVGHAAEGDAGPAAPAVRRHGDHVHGVRGGVVQDAERRHGVEHRVDIHGRIRAARTQQSATAVQVGGRVGAGLRGAAS